MRNHLFRYSGFTLVELMITVAVMGIIAFMGVPALQSLVENNRVATHTNRLVSSIHLARSEAIKRNEDVTLCPLGSGMNCGQDWSKGWQVVTADEVIQVVDATDQLVDIPSAPPRLIFDGEGVVSTDTAENANAPSEDERTIFIKKASFQRKVEVRLTGSVTSCRIDKDDACVE